MKVQIYTTINFSEKEFTSIRHHIDIDFFSEIYDMYAARLFGLILKWEKVKVKAEILLCNTFFKVWQSRALIDTKNENVFCWLCRHTRICYHEN